MTSVQGLCLGSYEVRPGSSEAIHEEKEMRRGGFFLPSCKCSLEVIRTFESIDDSAFEFEAAGAGGKNGEDNDGYY